MKQRTCGTAINLILWKWKLKRPWRVWREPYLLPSLWTQPFYSHLEKETYLNKLYKKSRMSLFFYRIYNLDQQPCPPGDFGRLENNFKSGLNKLKSTQKTNSETMFTEWVYAKSTAEESENFESNEFRVDWPQLDFSKIFLFFFLFKKEKNRRRYCLSFLIFLEKNHQNKISCAKCDLMKRQNQRQILVNYGVLWYKFTYCQKLHLMLRRYIFLLLYGFFSSTYLFRAFVVFIVLRWRNLSSKLT